MKIFGKCKGNSQFQKEIATLPLKTAKHKLESPRNKKNQLKPKKIRKKSNLLKSVEIC